MRVPCVGAVVLREDGRILLVRRGHPPAKGAWSLPGGRVEPGESLQEAIRREVLEETSLVVDIGEVVGTVELPGLRDEDVYVVTDFYATVVGDGSSLVAGDDAAECRWAACDELAALDVSPGLSETLARWLVWP